MTIRVNKKHIAQGTRNDVYENPIALAVCEQTGVEAVAVLCYDKGGDVIFGGFGCTLTEAVVGHIRAFDETGKMMPFEFELDVPQWMEKQGSLSDECMD